MPELVITQQRDHIFEIILNRPEERNAINLPMLAQLGEAIQQVEKAEGARVVIIRAEGRTFSLGIDLTDISPVGEKFGEDWQQNLYPVTAYYQHIFNLVERCSLPVIILMQGFTLGLAVELALACDIRIAAKGTRMGLPESRLGIIPDVGGTVRLTKLIGPARAKELIMTGRNFTLEEAERWGIVNYVVPRDQLLAKAEEIANELMQAAPLAVSFTKRVVNDLMQYQQGLRLEAWAQAQLMRTEDFKNGVDAVVNKQPIEWQGK